MTLMHKARKFAIFTLVALLLPALAAGALSLVWCVGLSGHSAIESAASSDYHETARHPSQARELCVEGGSCRDFDVLQLAEVPRKLAAAASPSQNAAAAAIVPDSDFGNSEPTLRVFRVWTDIAASQLAQLRTVVLLI